MHAVVCRPRNGMKVLEPEWRRKPHHYSAASNSAGTRSLIPFGGGKDRQRAINPHVRRWKDRARLTHYSPKIIKLLHT